MAITSPFPAVEIPDQSLATYVLARASEMGDKPALIDGPTGRTMTYTELDQQVRAFAGGLVARGFAKGEVLAILLPNIPEYAVFFHGTTFAGGIATTINPTLTPKEIQKHLVDSGATILITIPALIDAATFAAKDTAVKDVFIVGTMDGQRSVTELFGAPLAEQVPVDPDDVAALPFSSGTSGAMKGVMLSHRNLVANVAQTLLAAEIREDEMFIAVLPFFHIYGMQVLMNTALRAGATAVTMPRFDLEQFLEIHQKYGITRSFVAPPIVVALAKHPLVDQYDLSKLEQVFSGAAPLSAELAIEAGNRLGCEVVQGYGMTEMSPVSHLTPRGKNRPGTVGVTVPNTLTRIVDPATLQDVAVGEDGELWVQGPQVMLGYLNNPLATEEILTADGWLRTGDLARVDADGYIMIVDRLKELIKYKGFQVAPAELEALLLTNPKIADAAVTGLPDDEAGEIPVAHVVLKPGADASAEEIQAWVAEQVATYKQLRQVTIVDAIPKSASGKILRRLLRNP